ncbi:hypothetical protein Taro_013569 [Colocasia esculenta]|uniref:Uncharacterized protein n=1 Tax=Colocasia esculenta TaxID=4460 RepID=A0A843UC10_COLES|nr:hypothetical protein [Colocasia esculenta]
MPWSFWWRLLPGLSYIAFACYCALSEVGGVKRPVVHFRPPFFWVAQGGGAPLMCIGAVVRAV